MEKESLRTNFWQDAQKAGAILKELEFLRGEIEIFKEIETQVADLLELAAVYAENATEEEMAEIEKQGAQIMEKYAELEFRSLLGGKYDNSSVIMAIHSGAGGVDAQDWAEMLLRMYLRWAEKNGYKAKIVEESRGTEAGFKSATVEIEGAYAYGYLKSEAGVHRLVRLSPFNSDNLRQTSFALVEILPVIGEIQELKIEPQDLVIDTFRASGAGGQHVNTTDSAVRITHVPTGVVVTCQSERSQLQNKEQAMKVLKARLYKRYLEEQEQEKRKLRGEFKSVEWGNQIRSYVLHPYKMVKDHRSKYETSDAEKVLEGELEEIIEAYLRWNVANGN